MGFTMDDARSEAADAAMHSALEEGRERERAEIEYAAYVASRRKTRIQVAAACVALSSVAAAFSVVLLQKGMIQFESGASPILAAFLFATAFGGAALIYLRPAPSRRDAPTTNDVMNYVDFRVDELLNSRRSQSSEADKRDRDAAIESFRKKLESDAVKSVLDQIKTDALQATRRDGLEARLQSIRGRLRQEVQDLAKRGNLNLVLGIMTTLTGLCTLAYAVALSPASTTLSDFLGHFAPRLSLAVLIEVFAYFFLRLYKQTLSEIKYFQNELTNIESKIAAAMFALESGNSALLEKVALGLSKTERNFVIDKKQTTVDLERERLSVEGTSQALKIVREVIGQADRAK